MIWIRNGNVYFEGYQEIISVKEEEMVIAYKDKIIFAFGKDLRITSMNASELVIQGKIDSLQFTYD